MTPCRAVADHGRTAVYAAEEHAFGGTDVDAIVAWAVIEQITAVVVDGPWWREAGGPLVELAPARANARASTAVAGRDHTVIRIAAEQQTTATVTHELAHALAGVEAGHGARFRASHVDVVEVVQGRSAGAALSDAYRAFGLAVARRAWPAPVRGRGEGFVWLVP